jgi:hypothetical protein
MKQDKMDSALRAADSAAKPDTGIAGNEFNRGLSGPQVTWEIKTRWL